MQGELESSLERLNKIMEQKWIDQLDYNEVGSLHMGERFYSYKTNVINLEKIVEGQFNKMMKDVMEGLPHV